MDASRGTAGRPFGLARGLRPWLAVTAAAAATVAAACGPRPPAVTGWTPLPEPADGEVEAVVFLVGDAGEALPGRSPVLEHLRGEVERWSGRLARDSAVSVVYLGDIVYPVGVRSRGTDDFPADSARVQAQVDVVSGAAATRHRSPGFFLGGNHDWGQMAGPEGAARLRNLQLLLEAMAEAQGAAVELVPPAGDPGPRVVDVGERLRLVFVDTHWWLQTRDDGRADTVIQAMGEAIEDAGGRNVVFAAHHPFVSGGPHGGAMSFWEGLGVLYVLRRSGALIQDLNSAPYRELRLGLRRIFESVGRPLVWAGGHDHSLQVFRGVPDDGPVWSVVSGAGSKLTGVGGAEGMVFGAARSGYMRLTVLKSGEARLHVVAGREEPVLCEGDGARLERCIRDGVAAFDVVWARRLR